jgi:hypothetical protein
MINLENISFEIPHSMEEQKIESYKRKMNLAWKVIKNKAERQELGIYRIEFGTEANHQTNILLIPESIIPETMEFKRGTLNDPIYFPKDLAAYIINNLLKKKADVTRYGEVITDIINSKGETVDITKLKEIRSSVAKFTSEKSLINKGIALFEEFKEVRKGEKVTYFSIRNLYKNNYATIRGFHY